MQPLDAQLQSIERRADEMTARIERWCAINSGSRNRAGLARMAQVLAGDLADLGARLDRVPLPAFEMLDENGAPECFETGDALVLRKRPEAPRQVLLAIHYDTVYPETSDFQKVTRIDDDTLGGPGVADAKGGIALVHAALAAFEGTDAASRLGWTLILNPDEEVASPCSMGLLAERAGEADFGLVFEPCLADGTMIDRRMGSGNFTIVVRGRAAHVGRAFAEGRSAIHALAAIIDSVSGWNEALPGVIANTGTIRGGQANNVVPDLAVARVNLRVEDAQQQAELERRLAELTRRVARDREVEVEVDGAFLSPPRPVDAAMERLMGAVEQTAKELGQSVRWQASGGVCDGNKLAAAGLPNVDTMGPRGAEIHSPREILDLSSLVPRAQLTCALLHRYATDAFAVTSSAEAMLERTR